MKKIISWGMMLAAAFTLTNCAKEIENPNEQPETGGYPFEIVASTVDTKTVNDGISTNWADGDKINLFHAVSDGTDYINDGAFEVKETEFGNFKGELSEELDSQKEYDWYAFYPYDSHISTPANNSAGYMTVASSASGVQEQIGNDNMSHIAGKNYPLVGRTIAVPANSTPKIVMSHVSSLIAVKVKNTLEEPLLVESVSFSAPVEIVGTYYINFAGDITPDSFVGSGAKYVSKTATLNVSEGTAIATDQEAIFYLAVRPFVAKTNDKLIVTVNDYAKELTMIEDVTFSAGKIKTLNFAYDKVEESLETFTWDLTTNSYSESSTSEVTWTSDYADMVLAKGKSSTNANNYLGGTYAHTRVYKDQVLTLTAADAVNIKKVEFNVVSNYMDEFEGAIWSNATKSVNGLVMTVIPNDEHQPMSVTIGSATRFTSVKVYYALDPDYVAPTLVSIKVENPKTEYYVGDEFEAPKVLAVYDNGKEYEVNEGVTFNGFNSSDVVDEQEITVAYSGLTTSYTISIVEAPVIGDDPVPSTYQYILTTKPSIGSVALGNVNWTLSATNLNNYNSSNYAGVQFGTSSKTGKITLTSQDPFTYDGKSTITEIRLWLNNGSGTITPTVTINEVKCTMTGTITKNSSAGSDYTKASLVTFTPAQPTSGKVVIDLSCNKAGYFCAMEIDVQ